MIEINLLPKDQRKKRVKLEMPQVKYTPFIIGFVALIVAAQVFLSVSLAAKRSALQALEKKQGAIGPEAREAVGINRQIRALQGKANAIGNVKRDRMLWSKKLNRLSDLVTPGMWFTNLSLGKGEDGRYLSIKGHISSFLKDETAVIGRFMKALKEDKPFSKGFEEIRLEAMQQKKMKDVEVMSFSINCYFKKAG